MRNHLPLIILALSLWLGCAIAFTAALDAPAPTYIVHAN